MKEERFITAKEERSEMAKYIWWFIGVWVVIWGIAALVDFEDLLEDKTGQMALLLYGGGGVLLFMGWMAWLWIEGKAAQRERKQIMENGRMVVGIVTGVENIGQKGSQFVKSCVKVKYQSVDGLEKTWKSPPYSVNPYDYVGLQKECKMYVWGEKCCLADVPKRKQPTPDELMGEYAFLIPKEEEGGTEKHCVFKKGKKEGEIITSAKVKDLDMKYRIEMFHGLDKKSLEEAENEWHQLVGVETDAFLRFRPRMLELMRRYSMTFVYLEVRFISKRICSFSTRYAIEQDFDALIKELNFQYTEDDYEFLKSHIQSRMEESAKRHFGRIPVTEVLVELL